MTSQHLAYLALEELNGIKYIYDHTISDAIELVAFCNKVQVDIELKQSAFVVVSQTLKKFNLWRKL